MTANRQHQEPPTWEEIDMAELHRLLTMSGEYEQQAWLRPFILNLLRIQNRTIEWQIRQIIEPHFDRIWRKAQSNAWRNAQKRRWESQRTHRPADDFVFTDDATGEWPTS